MANGGAANFSRAGHRHGGRAFPGRGNFNGQYQPFYQKPNIDPHGYVWKSWPELTVELGNLPSQIRLTEVYDVLKPYGGSIFKIDIVSGQTLNSDRAFVAYNKPPLNDYWNSGPIAWGVERLHKVSALLKPYIPSKIVPDKSDPMGDLEALETHASELAFGILETEERILTLRELPAASSSSVSFKLLPRPREAHILFSLSLKHDLHEHAENGQDYPEGARADYKIVLPFSQLGKIWIRQQPGDVRVIVPCSVPPKVFRMMSNPTASMHPDERHWNANKAWIRQADIITQQQGLQQCQQPVDLFKKAPLVDIGSWNTYVFKVKPSWTASAAARTLVAVCENFNVPIHKFDTLEIVQSPSQIPPVFALLQSDTQGPEDLDMHGLSDLMQTHPRISLTWSVRYQLEVCMSQNVLNPWNITMEFLQKLQLLTEAKAIRLLEFICDKNKRIYDPMTIFSMRISPGFGLNKIPFYCVKQRSVTITPTTMHYASPQVEVSNRVIRQWNQQADRFLRVKFTDEKLEGHIFSSDDETNDPLFNRVYRCLSKGITIGDRHYEYLASGNSQLREHGAYFVAANRDCSPESIRKAMGDFNHITVPAKYASRLGQSFSTTRALSGTKVDVVQVDDIVRNNYNFTDGVGSMSELVARMVTHEHKLARTPSAVQFRLGGAKGVLTVNPALKGTKEVWIRDSQIKFPSRWEILEVIKPAAFIWAQLNRQLITQLECLGIPSSVFESKLRRQLRGVDEAMSDKDTALEQLQRRLDPNYTTLALSNMVEAGFMETGEPFVNSALQLWRSWIHKTLKEKASINVERGAFALGVVDETGTLKGHSDEPAEGDDSLPRIFLRIQRPNEEMSDVNAKENRRKDGTLIPKDVVCGTCVLMRNPSLHPGDVRVVKAVYKPELYHLKNVVVFPSKGDRDIPSMCSGGDLDGDDYFVSWDPKLIPSRDQRNYPPMEQLSLQPQIYQKAADEPIPIDEVIKFFVTYMKQDSLGRIANGWLALADKSSPMHQDCVRLAQEHSIAVDFLKTGIPARSQVIRPLIPREYPDFMENKRKRSYPSNKANGKLYRMVDRVEFHPQLWKPLDRRILEYYEELPDHLMKEATKHKHAYDTAIRRIMNQYGIKFEFEIVTGFILEHSRTVKSYELQTKIGELYEQIRDNFTKEAKDLMGGAQPENLWPFICALYRVVEIERRDFASQITKASAEDPEEFDAEYDLVPLISAPWTFYNELGKMVKIASSDPVPRMAKVSLKDPKGDAGLPSNTRIEEHGNGRGEGVQEHSSDEDIFMDAAETPGSATTPDTPVDEESSLTKASQKDSTQTVRAAMESLAIGVEPSRASDSDDQDAQEPPLSSDSADSGDDEPGPDRMAMLARLS